MTRTVAELEERKRDLLAMLERISFHGHNTDETNHALHVAYHDQVAEVELELAAARVADADLRVKSLGAKAKALEAVEQHRREVGPWLT